MNFASSLTKAHKRFLADLFPGDDCLTSPEELAVFSSDSSRLHASPWAVVRPGNRDQIVELLRWADVERMPIYGRARGTGQAGNAVPSKGGVVVSMLKMNNILEVDEDDFLAVIEPGVITSDFQAECEKRKLFYPPDPASVKISTVGGNVATCAGGLRAVKYGVTRDWVIGMEAVLPGGKILKMGGRSHKDVVGLDLMRLFVGANGKLGLMTELTLKLIPLPETTGSVLIGFRDLESSMKGASAVFKAGILPAACEFMDKTTLKAVGQGDDIPVHKDAQAALLFMVDGTQDNVMSELSSLIKAVEPTQPLSIEKGQGADEVAIWDVRRNISPAAYRIRPDKLSEDISVPRSKVPAAVEGAHKLGQKYDLPVLCFGHLGDGNIHVNIMHEASDAAQVKAAHMAVAELFHMTLELGGTISGEHGTGLTKASFVPAQLPKESIALMDAIKRNFDPNFIMNPGKAW